MNVHNYIKKKKKEESNNWKGCSGTPPFNQYLVIYVWENHKPHKIA